VSIKRTPDNNLSQAERQALAARYTRLVHRLARDMTSDADLQAEMIGEGNIGLMHAARKFDSTRGNFYGYAVRWIRHRQLACLRNKLNRPGGIRGLPVADSLNRFSFEDGMEGDEGDEGAEIERKIDDAQQLDRILAAVPSCWSESVRIARLHYEEGLPFQEIATREGLSHQKVSGEVNRGLRVLREIAEQIERGEEPALEADCPQQGELW
jgi:RNA polymerase sigma factor (sigma-70 family)